MTPLPKFVIRGAAVVVSMAMLAAALYAGWWRFGRPVVFLDFTDSIAVEQVHPMDGDRDSIGPPRLVDLRFPAGWSFTTDKAENVTIQRNFVIETELVYYVQIEYPYMPLDEVIAEARRVRDHLHITNTDLEPWYATKQRSGPTYDSEANGGRWIEGTDLSGKRLLVTYWINEVPGFTLPYQLTVEFLWMPPRPA